MMINEFEALTGFFPNDSLYRHIEQAYTESHLPKEEFCSNYAANKDGLAESIARAADLAAYKADEAADREREEKDNMIVNLQKKLAAREKELESLRRWEPYECSRMSARRYAELAAAGMEMGNNVSRWVSDEFGFMVGSIRILTEIPKYERSELSNRIRRNGTTRRAPVYASTDWNYVRFNVVCAGGTFQYEVVNGEIYAYID